MARVVAAGINLSVFLYVLDIWGRLPARNEALQMLPARAASQRRDGQGFRLVRRTLTRSSPRAGIVTVRSDRHRSPTAIESPSRPEYSE